jgi:hypothetical protein
VPPESPAPPGSPAPLQPSTAAAPLEEYLFTIGDIGVTAHWVVTPVGSAPIAGSQWAIVDQTRTYRKIPGWAIACAVIFFFVIFLFSLFFLLAKTTVVTGWLEVTVQSGSVRATAQVPVQSDGAIQTVRQRVAQAQTMAAAA